MASLHFSFVYKMLKVYSAKFHEHFDDPNRLKHTGHFVHNQNNIKTYVKLRTTNSQTITFQSII